MVGGDAGMVTACGISVYDPRRTTAVVLGAPGVETPLKGTLKVSHVSCPLLEPRKARWVSVLSLRNCCPYDATVPPSAGVIDQSHGSKLCNSLLNLFQSR